MPNIWTLIQKRFPSNEYALLQEVRDKAGHYASRSADGVAINLYPSRGLEVNGIEIKSSRGDWLREMKQPEKAEAIFKFCDRWWLITEDESVCKKDEVPATWGLLTVKGSRLFTIKEAPKLKPIPIDKHFMCALIKRATKGTVCISSLDDRVEEIVQERITSTRNSRDREIEDLKRQHDALKTKVDEFESTSGVDITNYRHSPVKIGNAVKFILDGGLEGIKANFDRIKKQLESNLENMNQVTF